MDGRHGWHERSIQGMVEDRRADVGQDGIQERLAQVLLFRWWYWGWWGGGLGKNGRGQQPTLGEALQTPKIPILTAMLPEASPPPADKDGQSRTHSPQFPLLGAWPSAGQVEAGGGRSMQENPQAWGMEGTPTGHSQREISSTHSRPTRKETGQGPQDKQ